jgi:hypothetical protein
MVETADFLPSPSEASVPAAFVSAQAAAALQLAVAQTTTHLRYMLIAAHIRKRLTSSSAFCSNGVALPHQSLCRALSSLEHISGALDLKRVFPCRDLLLRGCSLQRSATEQLPLVNGRKVT